MSIKENVNGLKSAVKTYFQNPSNVKAFYELELQGVNWNGKNQGLSLCLFHQDSKPSLSINGETGAFFCHGCGARGGDPIDFFMKRFNLSFPEAVKQLAGKVGISKSQRKISKIYDYLDAEGRLVFQVCRYEPKGFSQRRPDPNSKGRWIYDLKGVQLIPYNLPELIKSSYVIITEGEKDCQTLKGQGLVASTCPMGAGKWKEEYNQYFQNKRCYIIPDNDAVGKSHAQMVANSLKGVAESIKVIDLPGLPEKGDVSDWLNSGHTKEELVSLLKSAPEWKPKPNETLTDLPLKGLGDILRYEPPSFLIQDLLVKNSLTMLSAYTGTGKSLLSLGIAKAILTGESLLNLEVKEKGSVLLIDEETPGSILRDRLEKLGFAEDMPLSFLHFVGIRLDNDVIFNKLSTLIKRLKPSLVIIDSLIRIHNQKENEASMAFVMSRLRELCLLGTTLLVIHHQRKGSADLKEGVRGHSDILGAIDMAFCLEDRGDFLILSCVKSRLEPLPPIRLRLESSDGKLSFVSLGYEDRELENTILSLLGENPEGLMQGKIIEHLKSEWNEKKVRAVLKRGESVLWDVQKGGETGRALVYKLKYGNAEPYIYDFRISEFNRDKSKKDSVLEGVNTSETLDNSKFGNAEKVEKNHFRITEPFDNRGDSEIGNTESGIIDLTNEDFEVIEEKVSEAKGDQLVKVRFVKPWTSNVTGKKYEPGDILEIYSEGLQNFSDAIEVIDG